jgi:hypothetical protein
MLTKIETLDVTLKVTHLVSECFGAHFIYLSIDRRLYVHLFFEIEVSLLLTH